jgi:cold shock CspA family protein
MLTRRGLFGLLAGGGAAPFVKLPEANATPFPTRGSEPCTLNWFNRVRGFGFAHGTLSGHSIFVRASCFAKAGIEKPKWGATYFVAWELKPKGPFAYEIGEW